MQGADSFEEALENVQEAISAHLELLTENGEEIPLAKKIDEHISKPEFKDYGFIWAVVDVDVSWYLGKSEKINVTCLFSNIDGSTWICPTCEFKNRFT